MGSETVRDQIIAATGWPHVFVAPTSYVIRLTEGDDRNITGLCKSSSTLYLDFDDFAHIPISFLVEGEYYLIQYWTLNRQLHRQGDHPAKIRLTRANREAQTYQTMRRTWFWNGLAHREHGPANETFSMYRSDGETEEWKSGILGWWNAGISRVYPYAGHIDVGEGYRKTIRTPTRIIGEPDVSSEFFAEDLVIRTNLGQSLNDFKGFFIDTIVFKSFKCTTENDKVGAVEYDYMEIKYRINGEVRTVECDGQDETYRDLVSYMDVLRGPLLSKHQDEMIWISALSNEGQ